MCDLSRCVVDPGRDVFVGARLLDSLVQNGGHIPDELILHMTNLELFTRGQP